MSGARAAPDTPPQSSSRPGQPTDHPRTNIVTTAVPGTPHGLHLILTDIEEAAAEPTGRGVAVDGPFRRSAEERRIRIAAGRFARLS
ncbi:hypothetical protein [Nocardia araoensis]|uniref:hypothetical protein n=1 Tax=Nocardia araoensis TaxID=228600 RepID=UPI0002F007C2|nr:hypothetical protein [Nocardia araoensis]